jgi:DNA replication and repair protein RecF
MHITRIALTNFLSHISLSATFGDGLNVISGKNAVGKTNLVDSIYLCSVGRSSRYQKDKELVNWHGGAGARVTIDLQKKFSKHVVDVYIDKSGKKRILVDGIPVLRIGELMGVMNVVFFSPNELRLVKDAPQDRRRFLDISLCQQNKPYFYALVRYNKLLVQRNKLLKDYNSSASLKNMLELTDGQMVKEAALIIKLRHKFVESLSPLAAGAHALITSGSEVLSLSYETEVSSLENLEQNLKKVYENAFDSDVRMQYTTVGPHRDDVKIGASGLDLRKAGSQGQQRSAVLSLKLAEANLFKQKNGDAPILILDDVLSELDATRREKLFSALSGFQTFITCTEFIDTDKNYSEYKIEDNKVTSNK